MATSDDRQHPVWMGLSHRRRGLTRTRACLRSRVELRGSKRRDLRHFVGWSMSAPLLALSRRLRNTPFTSRIEQFPYRPTPCTTTCSFPPAFADSRRTTGTCETPCRSGTWPANARCNSRARRCSTRQLLTVRDISNFEVGRGGLVPVCDHQGRLINDPVVFRVAEDCYWFSISDSDVALWAGGLALGMGLDVEVSEPDVNPLAVQGRHSDDVLAKVFGDAIRETKFFRFAIHHFKGHPLRIAAAAGAPKVDSRSSSTIGRSAHSSTTRSAKQAHRMTSVRDVRT